MKLFHPLFLCSLVLIAASHAAQAQPVGPRSNAATKPADAPKAAKKSNAHASITWAKQRLDEMDATLASLESDLSKLNAQNKAKAEHARDEMRQQRDAFKQEIEANRQGDEAAWKRQRVNLESHWSKFEVAVRGWIDASDQNVAEQQTIFDARTKALFKSWDAMIEEMHASAVGFTEARKREADITLAKMRADADAQDAKLKALKEAKNESWAALKGALETSRAAFDRANRTGNEKLGTSAPEKGSPVEKSK